MPLHISRVEVENFRNFKHLLIDPFPATAVVVGANNVGKSNLLHALRIILDPDLPDSARRLREDDLYDDGAGPCVGEKVRIIIDLAGFGEDEKALAVLADCLLTVEPAVARIEYVYEPSEEIRSDDDEQENDSGAQEQPAVSIDDYDWQVLGGATESARPLRTEPRRYIGIRVLPALRDATDELTRRKSPLRELLDRVKPDQQILEGAAADVTAATEDLLTDQAISDLQQAVRKQTEDMIGSALPVSPTLGIAPALPHQLLRQIRLFADDARRRGMPDTSLGTANVIYLALLLQAVAARRSSREHVTTILGVEEPEAHLHVQIQRRLFGYLLRAEPALILTSHSPHVAAVAPLPSIVLLRSTDGGTVATTAPASLLSREQVRDLERYMDATRAELIFARVVVLVEGDAERYIVPAIAAAYGFDLTDHGVSVVSVQGTDFQPYKNLLGPSGLDIPHVAITDGDRDIEEFPATTSGLSRALRLMYNRPLSKKLREQGKFPLRPRRDGHVAMDLETRKLLVDELAAEEIYVGDTTLETDLVKLFPESFKEAASELFSERVAIKFNGFIDDIYRGGGLDVRRSLVDYIEAKGKGRFAQRLADHLSTADRVDMVDDQGDHRPEAALLRALDRVSLICRGESLEMRVEAGLDFEEMFSADGGAAGE
ncbi:AAA family ATPase [Micromonospora sp. STR1_7]|uniref:AAA family ATPase n=1 Tax=Micromonospora parastrephiae TaxID=2806101 RepID=A0ABS1XQ88_9ACTN|nr:AAA family ATPase [Micromonospora parastrephiae]MBM0231422.1 AAA family ATPase [Micromonospora parastrephiae]